MLLLALVFCAVFFALSAAAVEAQGWDALDRDLSGANAAGAARQAQEGEALMDALNWETLQQGYDIQGEPIRLDASITRLWLEQDASMQSYSGAATAAGLGDLLRGARLLDFFYLAGVYLFSWVGGLLRRRGGAGDLLLWVFLIWAVAHLFSDRQMITRALGLPLLMIFASYGVFAIVGTEPKPKERDQYASCVNRGALNLGDIPPTDGGLDHAGAFHPTNAGRVHANRTLHGLYAHMDAENEQQEKET